MKNMKKILALLVAVMVLAASMSAFAAGDGSIIINNAVAGHTYTAYQIFSGKWDANTAKLSDIKWGNGISTAGQTALETAYNKTGAAAVAGEIPNTDAGAQAFANNIGEGDNLGTGTTGSFGTGDNATKYTIPNLEDGYYMIVDTYTPAEGEKDVYYARYMIQKVGTATVNNKADKPEVDKKIVEGTAKVVESTANIGDTVTYEITSRVPDMTGYKEYYMDFSDILSKGLTYDANSLSVKIGDTTLTAPDAYTLTVGDYSATDGTAISVHLKDLVSRHYAKDAAIVITYTAKVNDNAVIGNTGNPNTVKLVYSNNPRNSGDGNPDTGDDGVKGETPDRTVKTFVTELQLVKVDKDSLETKLAGAVFNVVGTEINKVLITGEHFVEATDGAYWKLNDGSYTTKGPNTQIQDQYDTEGKKYKKEAYATESVQEAKNVAFQVVTGSDGIIKLTGLKEGTYTFTEIQAPDGYNLLENPITVTITSNIDRTDKTATFAWSATNAQETETGSGKFTFTVENGQGNTLPETGGMGTTILYIGGSILVLAAAILLITKRRMSSED